MNGFTWRGRGYPEIEFGGGQPTPLLSNGTQINNSLAIGLGASGDPLWRDGLHDHWYGMPDYYMMTGDEFIKEAMVPNKDFYINTNTTSYGLSPTNNGGITRGYGVGYWERRATEFTCRPSEILTHRQCLPADSISSTAMSMFNPVPRIPPGGTAQVYIPSAVSLDRSEQDTSAAAAAERPERGTRNQL